MVLFLRCERPQLFAHVGIEHLGWEDLDETKPLRLDSARATCLETRSSGTATRPTFRVFLGLWSPSNSSLHATK
jgi:hypothetical protein